MRLKQVANIKAGYPFRGKIPEVPDSSVVVVQMKDVSLSEGIDWFKCIKTELGGKRYTGFLTKGDILVAARGTHNYAILIDDGLVGSGWHAVAAPHFFVVSLTSHEVLPEYMAWLLNQPQVQRYFEQSSEGTLTKSIRRAVLEDTHIVIPTLQKQQTIVAMAKTLQQEQKTIEQLIKNREQLMNAITYDLFKNQDNDL